MGNRTRGSVVDWADLPGWVASLDDTSRALLTDALGTAASAARYQSIRDTIGEVLAREGPDDIAVAVVFGTMEWDDGYFLTATGTVLFADGSTDLLEFDSVDEIFTDEFGVRGPRFGLAVDLRAGDVDTDDHIDNLYRAHGYPQQR